MFKIKKKNQDNKYPKVGLRSIIECNIGCEIVIVNTYIYQFIFHNELSKCFTFDFFFNLKGSTDFSDPIL